ncbi:fumarate reductase/succinate dehydrogenase flavoprotein subunit [uncultured Megasphaera sp.]|uniref:fumarate reductase/succinate dehydrogenase flavoprotein subunit n=1 Tax=uncultured Megasphaera sp. TaxID=165188 RepID=UPI002659A0DD|nr:fumarate reductase/succinate dehydrogenase flavoprotein subunit [uncultured Megasphaera sp.]
MNIQTLHADVVIIGGGSAGTIAAIKAKEANPEAEVLIFDKGPIETSGAIGRGMDALNIMASPKYSTPEDVVEALTKVSEGILDQETAYVLGEKGIDVIKDLEDYTDRKPGDLFPIDKDGNYVTNYLHPTDKPLYLAMDGEDIKRGLAKRVKQLGTRVLGYTAAVKLFTTDGEVSGVFGFNIRTGQGYFVHTPTVILSAGCVGKFGLPRDGYLSGIYEFPGNTGEAYAMAYEAGAELVNMECFQTNLLMKDYNGPACGYVVYPRGGYSVNAEGNKYWTHGYWSGDMFLAVWKEFQEGRGPIYLKMSDLPEETINGLEKVLWGTERTTRGRFHLDRDESYHSWDSVEQGLEEITLCSGHSMSGIKVDKDTHTSVPGLFAAGDCASVPHQYLTGAFVFGAIAGYEAVQYAKKHKAKPVGVNLEALGDEIEEPLKRDGGLTPQDVEFKLRARISQYLTPPKNDHLMEKMLWWCDRIRREDIPRIVVEDYHDLVKVTEIKSILVCAEMAARASLFRTESRWGLSHYRLKYPKRDPKWDRKQVVVSKGREQMELQAVEVPPYQWDYPDRLEYEYPQVKLDIGEGYKPPKNENVDPWLDEKYEREGFEIPRRMVPGGKK